MPGATSPCHLMLAAEQQGVSAGTGTKYIQPAASPRVPYWPNSLGTLQHDPSTVLYEVPW